MAVTFLSNLKKIKNKSVMDQPFMKLRLRTYRDKSYYLRNGTEDYFKKCGPL